jgi:hypothetical protein
VINNKAQVLVRLKVFRFIVSNVRFIASSIVRSIKVRLDFVICNKVPYSLINGDLLL